MATAIMASKIQGLTELMKNHYEPSKNEWVTFKDVKAIAMESAGTDIQRYEFNEVAKTLGDGNRRKSRSSSKEYPVYEVGLRDRQTRTTAWCP